MKIFIQVVDSRTGIHQSGMINEPAGKGFEISNALGHFGVSQLNVDWSTEFIYDDVINSPKTMIGVVKDTSKIISVITIDLVVSDQPSLHGEKRSVATRSRVRQVNDGQLKAQTQQMHMYLNWRLPPVHFYKQTINMSRQYSHKTMLY